MQKQFTFYEFFAGGGLTRIGLGSGWKCLFANDNSEIKARVYRDNFPPADELVVRDINLISAGDIPGRADLAWASFPCQDLSLAGGGGGIRASRSGTFWAFWKLMTALDRESRAVPLIALENVAGLLTSNGGRDFHDLLNAMAISGYRMGAVEMDAARFVPQSRRRLFIIAVKNDLPLPQNLQARPAAESCVSKSIAAAYRNLSGELKNKWIWWNLPLPELERRSIDEIIEAESLDISFHTPEETKRLLNLMSEKNREKVRRAQTAGKLQVGTVYKRTRTENGRKRQMAEARFDGMSGCLRTPSGGSSRQTLLLVEGDRIRSRLLSIREAARLMGLPESYKLPEKYNDGYHVMGDAVVVPVISWIDEHLLRPLATAVSR